MKNIIITNKMITKDGKYENNYINNIDDKVVYIIPFLYKETTRSGHVKFTLEELISNASYKVDTHKGKSVDQFKESLVKMINHGLIEDISIDTIRNAKKNELLTCKLNQHIDKNDNGDYKNYFTLDMDTFNSICNDKDVDTINGLKLYFGIISKINRTDKIKSCYPTEKQLENELNLSSNTVNKYIDILKDKYIYVDNIGTVVKDGKHKTANNIYTIDNSDRNSAIESSKTYYESMGYVIKSVSSDEVQYKKSLAGMKGKISQLDRQGKDSSVLREKYEVVQEEHEGSYEDMTSDYIKPSSNAFENCINNNNPFGSNLSNIDVEKMVLEANKDYVVPKVIF